MAAPELDATTLAGLRQWLEAFGACVAAVDFASARPMFAPDAAGFGTYADVLEGRDAIEREQWRRVWPSIEDFRFDLDGLRVRLARDGLLAVAMVPFASIGIGQDGSRFNRPGRATLALMRDSIEAPWRAVHSHFSLNRGVPQRSHGQRPPAS